MGAFWLHFGTIDRSVDENDGYPTNVPSVTPACTIGPRSQFRGGCASVGWTPEPQDEDGEPGPSAGGGLSIVAPEELVQVQPSQSISNACQTSQGSQGCAQPRGTAGPGVPGQAWSSASGHHLPRKQLKSEVCHSPPRRYSCSLSSLN